MFYQQEILDKQHGKLLERSVFKSFSGPGGSSAFQFDLQDTFLLASNPLDRGECFDEKQGIQASSPAESLSYSLHTKDSFVHLSGLVLSSAC